MRPALLALLLAAAALGAAPACSLVIDDPAPFPEPEPDDAAPPEPDAGTPAIDFAFVDAATRQG